MKIAAKIILIVSGILAIINGASMISYAFISAVLCILAGVFALVGSAVKSKKMLMTAIVFSAFPGSFLMMLGGLLGIVYLMIEEYKHPLPGAPKQSGMRLAANIVLLVGGLIALETVVSSLVAAFAFWAMSGLAGFSAFGLFAYGYLSPVFALTDPDAMAEMFQLLFTDSEAMKLGLEAALTGDASIIMYIMLVLMVFFFLMVFVMIFNAIFLFVNSILAIKASNGKHYGKMGINIAVIIFSVLTLSIIPLVGGVLGIIASRKEALELKKNPGYAIKALPYKSK